VAGRAVNFLIYVNTGTAETPTYTKVAGQRGGTFNREYDTLDSTSKDSGNFTENEYGLGSWSIEGDGLLVESDSGFTALEDAFDNAEKVMVRFETAAGNKYEGSAIITDFPIEAPYDDIATYSITLTGDRAYTKTSV